MNDNELGRLARALLADLDAAPGYEGKVLTVARVLTHVRECERQRTTTAREDALPWQALWETDSTARRAPSLADLEERVSSAGAISLRLVNDAPGPITRYARMLALVASQAQLAIQWGEPMEMCRILAWVGDASIAISKEAVLPALEDAFSPFQFIAALAYIGGVLNLTGSDYDPEMLIGIARRTVANLGSIAREAAAAEGRPECRRRFWLTDGITDSIRGFEPEQSRVCVAQLAVLLCCPPIQVRPTDVEALRKIKEGSHKPNPEGLAARSERSAAAWRAAERQRQANGR